MSKKHCYTVRIRRATNMPGLLYHVLAESKAQARAHVANTMIEVERTDPLDILDLRRDQVIDATEVPATGGEDEQKPLPLPPIDPIDEATQAFDHDTVPVTAAEALESPR